MSGRRSSAFPTMKNVPLASCSSRMRATRSVYGSSGPSSKVNDTSRTSRGPWATCDPNHVTVGELAPTQKVTPPTSTTPTVAASRTEPRARRPPPLGGPPPAASAAPGHGHAVDQSRPGGAVPPVDADDKGRAHHPEPGAADRLTALHRPDPGAGQPHPDPEADAEDHRRR